MMPITDNTKFYSYLPETSSRTGVLKGYEAESKTEKKTDLDIASLGKNDFMKLLIAQMRHQDPLNPASNTEFVAQLAQFSSLEQMTEMNANLENTLENNLLMVEAVNNAMMINYFGKKVSAETNSFIYDGKKPIELQFILDSAISSGTLEIINENGITARTLQLDDLKGGSNTVEWDGISNLGVKSAAGRYSYNIDAYDVLNNRVEASQIFSGIVEGIAYRDGKAQLSVGGLLIPFNSVQLITEEE